MARAPLIFSTHTLHPKVTADLQAMGDLRIASAPTPQAIMAESGGAEIIVVRAPIDVKIVERERQLKAMIRHGAGLDMIPVETATKCGVLVANVPGVNAVTVAEHVIWSSLALLRQHPRVSGDLRAHGWEAGRRHSNAGRELSGRTLGIVGMGNVGRALFKIARNGFGMTVVTHTRTPENVPEGAAPVAFSKLLEQADIVALCCPLTPQTKGLIDSAALFSMKDGAVLINVSRGAVVEEAPLIDALQSNRLAGAALDVFGAQPLPPGHPLFSLDNVILTPHMAGITEESMLRMGEGVVAETRRIIKDEMPYSLVNPEAVAHYRSRFSGS
ncbi:MAG: dehydrogenase [Hyphomicrobiales bacterium]|nr:dehydrogenase [Hyphomicrobiales bacterium]